MGLLASGCDVKGFRVRLNNFVASETLGLWVWQRSPATGKFVRHSQIEFGDIYRSGGQEYMTYTFTRAAQPMGLQTVVARSAGNPDTVTLNLAFAAGSGAYKMSSFNEVGESPLSSGTHVR